MQKLGKEVISVSLVIPVYNGEKVIIDQIKKCEEILKSFTDQYEIIIADDKSLDNTKALLAKNFGKKKKFRLIFNNTNIGIARNIKNLYSLANFEYVCLYSADGGWNVKDIKKLIIHAHDNKLDIVIGERNRKNYTLYRKTVSFLYNFLPQLFFGVKTIDAGSIKVIKRDLIRNINIVSTSVFFEAELIIRAVKQGNKISSIPVYFIRHSNKKSSSGKPTLLFPSLIDMIKLRLRI